MPSIATTAAANSGDAGETAKAMFLGMDTWLLVAIIIALVVLVLVLIWYCHRKGWCECCCSSSNEDNNKRPERTFYEKPTRQQKNSAPPSNADNINRKKKRAPQQRKTQQQPRKTKQQGGASAGKGKRTSKTNSRIKLGAIVTVEGYPCKGVVRFIGKHHIVGQDRIGVELIEPVGRNNGTIADHVYFKCAAKHGVLVIPSKVSIPKAKAKAKKTPSQQGAKKRHFSNPFGGARRQRLESVVENPGFKQHSVDDDEEPTSFELQTQQSVAINPSYGGVIE